MDYMFHLLVIIGVYIILASSLDLLMGRAGLMSVAHAAFFGIGAYTSASLSLHTELQFPSIVLLAVLVAVLASLPITFASLRLQDDYFVIATLAFQMLFVATCNNMIEFTHGPLGISGIPRPSLFGWQLQSPLHFALLSIALAGFSCLVVARITGSPFGRILVAIREDEVLAASKGKNTTSTKRTVFAVAGALAALAGILFAHYTTYISPQAFSVTESIIVISMVLIGGPSSNWGPVFGAVLLVLLPELLRFAGFPNPVAANVRQILYGAVLVTFVMWRPQGLLGKDIFNPTREAGQLDA